ncbi:MAG: SAM-dependent methyltransferase, partial [Burkholderiales bacterium]|nr:SAM-dependent methyltransferase [Burkholderiales bacterium]
DVKWRQTPVGVAELNVKQASILASAARMVKPGGRLVYATCSILDEENEGIVQAFLAEHADYVLVPASQVLAEQKVDLEMGDYLKLYPHLHQTDGFFAAIMERKKAPAKVAPEEVAPEADAEED